jgi:hypothetical protein
MDGARLSIDPGRILTHDELPDLVHLVLRSKPAHVDFYRIFHGYDLRPIGASGPAALDDGLLSDDSGVWVNVNGEDVKLSFGSTISRWIDASAGHAVYSARTDTHFSRVWYEDRARLDVWPLDSEIVPNRRFVLTSLMGILIPGIDAHPPSLGRHLNIARSALDLDDDRDGLDDLNCGFAGGIDLEYHPFVLSESRLDEHDHDLRHVFIDERFTQTHTAAPAPLNPQEVYPGIRRHDLLSRHVPLDVWPEATWQDGGWDTRRWRSESIRIPTRMTTTEKEDE